MVGPVGVFTHRYTDLRDLAVLLHTNSGSDDAYTKLAISFGTFGTLVAHHSNLHSTLGVGS